MDLADIKKRVHRIVGEVADVVSEKVLDDSKIGAGLGIGNTLGSGELLTLKDRLEEEFCIDIPSGDIPSLKDLPDVTVGQIVRFVGDLLSSSEAAVSLENCVSEEDPGS